MKQINKVICIGTSFMEGDGLNPHDTRKNAVDWYLANKNLRVSMETHRWSTVLEKLLNIKVENLAKSGSSIEYLMRNVEEVLEQEDCTNTLFILEYSGWGRSELWSNLYKQWLITNWGPRDGEEASNEGYEVMMTTGYNYGKQLDDKYFKIYEAFLDNFLNEHEYLLQRDRHFLNLLYKLHHRGISYELLKIENPYLVGLNEHQLFKPKLLIEQNLWGYADKHNLTITKETNGAVVNSHLSVSGHEYIANLIFNKLKDSYYLE